MPKGKTLQVNSKMMAARKARFLKEFALCGTIGAAAAKANTTRERHYHWIKEDPAYAEAFRLAVEEAADMLEGEAIHRAVEGETVTIYDKDGNVAREEQKKSDALLAMLLKAWKKDRYGDRVDVNQQHLHLHAHRFDAQETDLGGESIARILRSLASETGRPGVADQGTDRTSGGEEA
jgi:hypothetical protein